MDQDISNANKLKYNGLKITKQRIAILDILEKSEQPISAEQIYIILLDENISVSLSTVYRTLDVMTEKNMVTKITISQDGKTLYEINCELHRHYLYCLRCNKILTIKHCPLENYEQSLIDKTGYDIVGHKLNVYGYCPECKKKETESRTKTNKS